MMHIMTDAINALRAQGLTEQEILLQLDEAKRQLALMSGPELLTRLRAINPKYTQTAIYKRIARSYKTRACKLDGTWYLTRADAEDWLTQARHKPANEN